MDNVFLLKALKLAEKRKGSCSPNPSVGCVVVRDKEILGEGFHWAAGYPHAEVDALKNVSDAEGATAYVTLEPCCFFGRTPPCTDLLIERGIKRVVYGLRDPNPRVEGKGQSLLLEAGISCHHLSLSEIDTFYRSYQFWIQSKRPFTSVKLALSLDGKAAAVERAQRLLLTADEASRRTHEERLRADAILTTSETILADDPKLNARLSEEAIAKPIYVLDTSLRVPLKASIYRTAQKLTFFHSASASKEKMHQITEAGAHCISLPQNDLEVGLQLKAALEQIGQDGVHDLWIEAGPLLFRTLHQHKLVQRTLLYLSPQWVGSGRGVEWQGISFKLSSQIQWQSLGQDALCEVIW